MSRMKLKPPKGPKLVSMIDEFDRIDHQIEMICDLLSAMGEEEVISASTARSISNRLNDLLDRRTCAEIYFLNRDPEGVSVGEATLCAELTRLQRLYGVMDDDMREVGGDDE